VDVIGRKFCGARAVRWLGFFKRVMKFAAGNTSEVESADRRGSYKKQAEATHFIATGAV